MQDVRWWSSPVCTSLSLYDRLDGVESTGEINERDSHSAASFMQVRESSFKEVDDGMIHSNAGLVDAKF